MYEKDIHEQVLSLKRNGLKITEIHNITGVPYNTIRNWVNRKTKKFNDNLINGKSILEHYISQNARKKGHQFYSYTLGFYFSKGNIYENKRTYELAFHIDKNKIKYFEECFKKLYDKSISYDNNKNIQSISIYWNKIPKLYSINKDIEIWQMDFLDIKWFFKGLVDPFLNNYEQYIFKCSNDKVKDIFKGCCIQVGINIENKNNKLIIAEKSMKQFNRIIK